MRGADADAKRPGLAVAFEPQRRSLCGQAAAWYICEYCAPVTAGIWSLSAVDVPSGAVVAFAVTVGSATPLLLEDHAASFNSSLRNVACVYPRLTRIPRPPVYGEMQTCPEVHCSSVEQSVDVQQLDAVARVKVSDSPLPPVTVAGSLQPFVAGRPA
jgi:hypothetical protein